MVNPSLRRQQDDFKKTMLRQPILPRPQVGPLCSYQEIPVSTASPAPSNASSGRHVNSIVHSIVTILKNANGAPVSFQEVRAATGIDLNIQANILDRLLRNERIFFDEPQQRLTFQLSLPIRNEEELLKLLRNQRHMTPLEINELKVNNPLLEDIAAELCREHKAFMFRPREDSPNKLLFLNDYSNYPKVDNDFKKLWANINITEDTNQLVVAIEKSGMRAHSKVDTSTKSYPPGTQPEKEKKPTAPKRSFRKIKITNDYLEDIDLNL